MRTRRILPLPRSRLRSGTASVGECGLEEGPYDNASAILASGVSGDEYDEDEDDESFVAFSSSVADDGVGGGEWVESSVNTKKRKVPTPAVAHGFVSESFGSGGGAMAAPGGRLRRVSYPMRNSKTRDVRRARRLASLNIDSSVAEVDSPEASFNAVDTRQGGGGGGAVFEIEPPTGSFQFTCESDTGKAYSARASVEVVDAAARTSVHPSEASVHHGEAGPATAHLEREPAAQPRRPVLSAKARQELLRRNHLRRVGVDELNNGGWVCQICEYEALFGSLPEMLMQRVSQRERRERRAAQERRRLLEKAKAKARKNSGRAGKKQGSDSYSSASHHMHGDGTSVKSHARTRRGTIHDHEGIHSDDDDEGDDQQCPDCGALHLSHHGAYGHDYYDDEDDVVDEDEIEDDEYDYEHAEYGDEDGESDELDCECRCCHCHRRLHRSQEGG